MTDMSAKILRNIRSLWAKNFALWSQMMVDGRNEVATSTPHSYGGNMGVLEVTSGRDLRNMNCWFKSLRNKDALGMLSYDNFA